MFKIRRSNALLGVLIMIILLAIFWGSVLGGSSRAGGQTVASQAEDTQIHLPLILNHQSTAGTQPGIRTVNATYFNADVLPRAMGIFWFGKITPVENYVDVRVGYNATELVVDINVIDRLLWYDLTPSESDLTEWDTSSLFLSTSSAPGNTLTAEDYKFVGQVNQWQPREDYQAVYQGQGTQWVLANIPFETDSSWRGQGLNNDLPDRGWGMRYIIPFESLGFSTPPHGAVWRIGVLIHDRDDQENTPIEDKFWPESIDPVLPDSWGGLHLGQLSFIPPVVPPDGVATIKNGVNGAVVPDAHVGGAFNCGDGLIQWTEWGETNYEGIDPTQINIQNQEDMADWPCFSKYFITFPLDSIPPGSTLISATLTMYHFGNSGIGWDPPPQYSWIQVLTVAEDWVDTSITWNNAPLAYQNITMTRVDPIDYNPNWPGIPYHWDVSLAVDAALQAGTPLRLALYSADSAIHSGKYFYSSDSGNNDPSARPVLTVTWANP